MYVQLLVLSDFRNLRLHVIRNPVMIPIKKFPQFSSPGWLVVGGD